MKLRGGHRTEYGDDDCAAPADTGRGADETIQIEVDEALTVLSATLEDWVAPLQNWELQLREGHDSGRANNIEARILYVAGARLTSNGLDVELFHILTFT